MAFTSAEDLGGYSTTDQDAFSETGETGYTDYSSYDSPNQSSGPSGGGLLGGGNFFSRQMQGVDPRYSHLTTVQDMYDKGWTKEHLNAAGNIILKNREKKSYLDKATEQYGGIGTEVPGGMNSEQWEQYQQIPVSPVDFSKPPSGQNPNFKIQVNPYVPTDAMKGTQGSIFNQDYTGAQGEQYADNVVRSWAFDKPPTAASQSNVPPNLARAYNAKANMANAKHVADSGQIMTDAITLPERGQMSDKQVVEVLNRRPDASTIHAVDYEPYGSNGYASLLGVPIGEMQDSYKPVYSDEDQNAINNWRMGTDLYNTRGGMSDADQASISRGNIDVYPENFVMIDGKPVSRNNLGSNGGADGGFNFNFNLPGIGSFSNTEGRQDSIGFPNKTLTWQEEEAQAIRNNPESFIPDHGGRIESSMPAINLVGAGIVGLGSAFARFGVQNAKQFVSKYGLPMFRSLQQMLKPGKTGLDKISKESFRRDLYPTVTEQGLMKAAVRNKAGLGTHTPKELGTINRNITKTDQHPNFLSNKEFRKARIDKGEVKANVHPNTLNPSKNVPAIVHKQPPKGTNRDLGGMGAKGANKEDIRNMATALKLEANKKRTKLMADNKRIIAKNKKAKAKKAKKANKKRK